MQAGCQNWFGRIVDVGDLGSFGWFYLFDLEKLMVLMLDWRLVEGVSLCSLRC